MHIISIIRKPSAPRLHQLIDSRSRVGNNMIIYNVFSICYLLIIYNLYIYILIENIFLDIFIKFRYPPPP